MYCGTQGLLRGIKTDKVRDFEKTFLEILETRCKDTVLEPIKKGVLDKTVTDAIESVAKEVVAMLQ